MSLIAPQTTDAATRIAVIRRHLNKWELSHLRALAASLADRLEKAEEELARSRADADAAWRDADFWQTQAQTLIEELREAGTEVGMTQTGELVPMPMADADIDAVHAQHPGKNDCATPSSADAYTTPATQPQVGKI